MPNRLLLSLFAIAFATLAGCSDLQPRLLSGTLKGGKPLVDIPVWRETTPVASADDAADDPAIWVHPDDPSGSLIIGTNKQQGLVVYDLQGREVQRLDTGRPNNIDLRQGVELNGAVVDLAVASNRSGNTLDIFRIDRQTGQLALVGLQALDLPEPYGTCMYHAADGSVHVFVNDKDGRYQQWEIQSLMPLRLSLVRQFSVATQPEGCTADDQTGNLFVGEEGRGVWVLGASPDWVGQAELIASVESDILSADVEGMDLWRTDERTLLIVSSQGDYSYALFNGIAPFEYLGSFQLVDNQTGVDGVEETDGLAVTSRSLGVGLERGLLVVQDGFNQHPTENQNFKMVPFQRVERMLGR